MDIFDILSLLCGLALFLYGMEVMGDSLKKSAGSKLKEILGKMKDKDKLLEALRNMVAETYNSLMDEGDEGNVEWTATI